VSFRHFVESGFEQLAEAGSGGGELDFEFVTHFDEFVHLLHVSLCARRVNKS
jgi:hypothetical protein